MKRLLENRQEIYAPRFRLSINGVPLPNIHLMPFIKEGKHQSYYNNAYSILMIFRNNTLVANQLCFMLSQNVWQSQFRYLLVVNRSRKCFILLKNKSRFSIHPGSENCFEHNSCTTSIYMYNPK
jgi:hypothetical protein